MVANLASGSIKSAGSTTSQTFADRFAIIRSVKDFGALGDGVTDDTASIQAAINKDGDNAGIIFFPPGIYKLTSALTFNTVNSHSITLRGCGDASKLSGSIADFLVKRSVTGAGNPSLDLIENLWIENGSNNSAAGGILWNSTEAITIRNCRVNAQTGIAFRDSAFGIVVDNVLMSGPGSSGVFPSATGVDIQSNFASVRGCRIIGFGNGIRCGNGASVFSFNNELENCGNGLNLGSNSSGGSDSSGGNTIVSTNFECCDVGIWARNVATSTFISIVINGHAGMTPDLSGYGAGGAGRGDGWSTYGIVAGFGGRNTWMDIQVLGDLSTLGYYTSAILITNAGGVAELSNLWVNVLACNGGVAPSGSVVKWSISGADVTQLACLWCQQGTNSGDGSTWSPADFAALNRTLVYSKLPSTPATGMIYTITDGSGVAVGGSVTSGSSSSKYLLWYNGTNWIRTA